MKLPTLNYKQLKQCRDKLPPIGSDDVYDLLCLEGFLTRVRQSFDEGKISKRERKDLTEVRVWNIYESTKEDYEENYKAMKGLAKAMERFEKT